MDKISNAVPASSPFLSTSFEIESGFSSTDLCEDADPIEDTIHSHTRARIVYSAAPPTNCLMFARTVTRAFAIN